MVTVTNVVLARSAIGLATRGMRVFQLAPGTKVPMAGSHGYLDASNDAEVIRGRWDRHPRANIGIATGAHSGIWVLDVDRQHGGIGALARMESEHGALPLTIEVSTPSGGRHLYFGWPAKGPEIRCSTSRLGPGIDVRAEGGSIVAPPSLLADGRRYRWASNGARDFAGAPPWLIALALPPSQPVSREPKLLTGDVSRYCAKAVASELAELDQAKPGTRNVALNRAAFALGRFAGEGVLPVDWATAELERRACAIGLSVTEARGTIASGLRAGMREPRELRHG